MKCNYNDKFTLNPIHFLNIQQMLKPDIFRTKNIGRIWVNSLVFPTQEQCDWMVDHCDVILTLFPFPRHSEQSSSALSSAYEL